ncbi:hypothetical protein MKX01_004783 [Papaver californicum]|nr:hypothetical protein MKX01_004783 [Papaver californicum]
MMVFMALMFNSEVVNGEVSCGDALSNLVPCGSYLMGSGSYTPLKECCDVCLKQTGPSFGVKADNVKQFLVLCKLKLNIPITPDIDYSFFIEDVHL